MKNLKIKIIRPISAPVMPKLFMPVLAVFFLAMCVSSPKFDGVMNRDWKLSEVLIGGTSIGFDRDKLADEGFGEIYTLRFDAERVNGIGAPNRYFAPYTLGDKNTITIKTMAGTLMASFREPEALKENEYYKLLQNVKIWNLKNDSLRLYSNGDGTEEAVLIFTE